MNIFTSGNVIPEIKNYGKPF